MAEKGPEVKINCLYCGIEKTIRAVDFKRGKGKYCSRECAWDAKIKPRKACLNCGNEVETKPSKNKYCSSSCAYQAKKIPPEERFWDKVKKTEGCWEWQAGLFDSGYGAFSVNGKPELAHRFSYTLNIGPIPEGLWVLHHCDNRKCVKPEHFFLGTAYDNATDMINKGRHGTKGIGWIRI